MSYEENFQISNPKQLSANYFANRPLSECRVYQLLNGMKTYGNAQDAANSVQESFYINEAQLIFDFCKWIDNEIGGCGPINIQELWAAFHNQSDEQSWRLINYWKTKLAKYKNL